MKRIFLTTFIAIVCTIVSFAQESITDSWWGELNVGTQKLRLKFNIERFEDIAKGCTMDSPDQGVNGIPVKLLKASEDTLKISIPALNAGYTGVKISDSLIKGRFTQNGLNFDLNLQPGTVKIRRPQTPTPPFPYLTEDITFRNEAEGAVLSGTITYPVAGYKYKGGTMPIVLMVTGSGSQNRDEEIFNHKPFLVLADYLAKNGIASLRYDDRGVGKSTGQRKGTTSLNNLADAEAGIAFLRKYGKFGKIGVLGHSEGGTIAFMMGANKSVDFIISLAGGAANGIDVIVGQNRAQMDLQGVPSDIADQYCSASILLYKDRIAGIKIADPKKYVDELCKKHSYNLPIAFKNNLAKCTTYGEEWLTWFIGYNPAEAISKITCPVMAINGTLDMQVLSKDNIPVIKANLQPNDKNLIKEYDSLNHLFQHCTTATALSYAGIEETISEEVLSDIAKWIIMLLR